MSAMWMNLAASKKNVSSPCTQVLVQELASMIARPADEAAEANSLAARFAESDDEQKRARLVVGSAVTREPTRSSMTARPARDDDEHLY